MIRLLTHFIIRQKKKITAFGKKTEFIKRGLFRERKIYPILAHKTRLVGFIMEIVLWAYPLVQQGKSGVVYLQYTFISEGVLMWFRHKWCYNIVNSDQSVFCRREVDLWVCVFRQLHCSKFLHIGMCSISYQANDWNLLAILLYNLVIQLLINFLCVVGN